MGLMAECLEYVGRLVIVTPFYGWGWAFGPDSPFSDYDQVEALGPFRVRLKEFYRVGGELRGATGVIEEPDCPLNGALNEFSTRHVGDWNFSSRLADYNVSIGSRFVQHHSGQKSATGTPSLQGFAEIKHAV
jgi:hypothetical protein